MSFSKNPTFRDSFFIEEGQTERGMGMMNLRVTIGYFVTPLET
jgi:hypothetical protein